MSSTRTPCRQSGEGGLWWTLTTVTCTVGIILAVAKLGVGGLLTCWVFTGFITMCMDLLVRGPGLRHTNWMRLTALGGVMSTAAVGLASSLGSVGLVWILAVAATSGTCRCFVRDRLLRPRRRTGADDTVTRGPSGVTPETEPDSPPAPELSVATVRDLDDEALCIAWRRSYVQLQRSSSPTAQIRHVQQRQRLLDELERRNPDGLAAWLASGCRAAGNPLPFLTRSPASEGTGDDAGDDDPPGPGGEEGSHRTS